MNATVFPFAAALVVGLVRVLDFLTVIRGSLAHVTLRNTGSAKTAPKPARFAVLAGWCDASVLRDRVRIQPDEETE
jgi:hypothetical protein